MRHTVSGITEGSIAQRLGIRAGDRLVSVNGNPVRDLIDWEFFCAEKRIELIMLRGEEEMAYSFTKGEYESVGLEFERPMMDGVRSCANRCVFCFEDQNPPGVRDTLHSRDDDWRLSLMTGSYITLTNVPDRELKRIIERHASPLYISVHATDGDLRTKMLRNPKAGRILEQLRMLADGGISFHTQCVICPGWNDGEQLEKTIHDLACLSPHALSLAVVPAGLTEHRENCEPLRLFTREEARANLEICRKWRAICREHFGSAFVHPADELYLLAEEELPAAEEYEDFGQIENGVGMLRLLEEEYAMVYDAEYPDPPVCTGGRRLLIATGKAAGPFLRGMLRKRPVPGVEIEVRELENTFFGRTVTTAGLLTGHELLDEANGLRESGAEAIWVTECMLREGEDLLLDDMTLQEVSDRLGIPVTAVPRGGDALFDMLTEFADNE